jgi:hypothetical protein
LTGEAAPSKKQEQVTRFMGLFRGLDRARGIWHPNNGMMETARDAPALKHFLDHLQGTEGLGVTPITDENLCHWAVLDVDAHEDDWYIEIPALAMKVEEHALPLITCQSKSHGAHLYLFLRDPQPAAKIQEILKDWAALLKEETVVRSKSRGGEVVGPALVEIFPKQKRLSRDQIGNWVNLPYFNARDTTRFAFNSGRQLNLDEFLDLAESKKATREQLFGTKSDHSDAPPCVQHMLMNGIDMGSRNNSLFAIGVYLRKSGVDDLAEALSAINYDKDITPKPLAAREVTTIAKSAMRPQYKYRCNETPLCDLCDKETCRTRKFGVGEAGPSKAYDAAMFGSLKKILSDPPRWILEVNGIEIEFTTEGLLDYKQVRKGMLERVAIIAPPMKNEDWAIILRGKNEQRAEISAPEDAGPGAMIKALLSEFTRGVERVNALGQPILGRKEDLLRGMPVALLDNDTEEHFVYFRGVDFISMLKRKRAEEFKGAALWAILRNIGCTHDKIRIGQQVTQVWAKPFVPWNVEYTLPNLKEDF